MTTKTQNTVTQDNTNSTTTTTTKKNNNSTKKWTFLDYLIFFWLHLDLFVHVVLEGGYTYFQFTTPIATAPKPTNLLGKLIYWVWYQYGTYGDTAWLYFNDTIMSIEIFTVIFVNISLLLAIHHMWFGNDAKRHFWQIVLCVCEMYGVWFSFCPESFDGFPTVTRDPFYLFTYVICFNGTYVIIPLLLLIQSYHYFTSHHHSAVVKQQQVNEKKLN
ncbi:hypothetical protein ABK040_007333 [Willaertia magna]